MQRVLDGMTYHRIAGVDGNQWWDGTIGGLGRPRWDFSAIEDLKDQGIVGDAHWYPLIPAEVGCALTHRAAWEYIVSEKIPRAVILEDDVAPAPAFKGTFKESVEAFSELPADAPVVFLQGIDRQYSLDIIVDAEHRIVNGGGNMGYVITQEAAQVAIAAQFPMFYPCDFQWWGVAFDTFHTDFSYLVPGVPKHAAYVTPHAVINVADYGYQTTMTPSGEKPWRPTHD